MAENISGIYLMLEGNEAEIAAVAYGREPAWLTENPANHALRVKDESGSVHYLYEYTALNDLTDVDVSAMISGQLLGFDGSNFIPFDQVAEGSGNLVIFQDGFVVKNFDTTFKTVGSGALDFSATTSGILLDNWTTAGAQGRNSFAEGYNTYASGMVSHAEGSNTLAAGWVSHAEGDNNEAGRAISYYENGFGILNVGPFPGQHVEGELNLAYNSGGHAEGYHNIVGAFIPTYNYAGTPLDESNFVAEMDRLFTIIYNSDTGATPYTFDWLSFRDSVFDRDGFQIMSGPIGTYAHVEGGENIAGGSYSHVEGYRNMVGAYAANSHAEGYSNRVFGTDSHAEGYNNYISIFSQACHAEGHSNRIGGLVDDASEGATYVHIEGYGNIVYDGASVSHVEGYQNKTYSHLSHLEGQLNEMYAFSSYAHIQGYSNIVTSSATATHVEGYNHLMTRAHSHVEGDTNEVYGHAAHAEGNRNIAGTAKKTGSEYDASGNMLDRNGTIVDIKDVFYEPRSGFTAHVEGNVNIASASKSHAEGENNIAGPVSKLTETGHYNAVGAPITYTWLQSSGNYGENSHVEGNSVQTFAEAAHAEGIGTIAGDSSLTFDPIFSGVNLVKEEWTSAYDLIDKGLDFTLPENRISVGLAAHAEGIHTIAEGSASHAGGHGTYAPNYAMTAIGKFNDPKSDSIFEVGIGTSSSGLLTGLRTDLNGLSYSDQADNASIAAASGTVLITKDYMSAYSPVWMFGSQEELQAGLDIGKTVFYLKGNDWADSVYLSGVLTIPENTDIYIHSNQNSINTGLRLGSDLDVVWSGSTVGSLHIDRLIIQNHKLGIDHRMTGGGGAGQAVEILQLQIADGGTIGTDDGTPSSTLPIYVSRITGWTGWTLNVADNISLIYEENVDNVTISSGVSIVTNTFWLTPESSGSGSTPSGILWEYDGTELNPITDPTHMTLGNPSSPTGRFDIEVITTVSGDLTVSGTELGTGPGGVGTADGVYTFVGGSLGAMDMVYQRGTDEVYVGRVSSIWIITWDNSPGLWTDGEYFLNSLTPIGTYEPIAGSGNSANPTVVTGGAAGNPLAINTNGEIKTSSQVSSSDYYIYDGTYYGAIGFAADLPGVLGFDTNVTGADAYIFRQASIDMLKIAQDGSINATQCAIGDITDPKDLITLEYYNNITPSGTQQDLLSVTWEGNTTDTNLIVSSGNYTSTLGVNTIGGVAYADFYDSSNGHQLTINNDSITIIDGAGAATLIQPEYITTYDSEGRTISLQPNGYNNYATLAFNDGTTPAYITYSGGLVDCSSNADFNGVTLGDAGPFEFISSNNDGLIIGVADRFNILNNSYINLAGTTAGFDLFHGIRANAAENDVYFGETETRVNYTPPSGLVADRTGLTAGEGVVGIYSTDYSLTINTTKSIFNSRVEGLDPVDNGDFVTLSYFNTNTALSGTTASRPSGTVATGRMYFATDLGYPIWFNGTHWVNATGAYVAPAL